MRAIPRTDWSPTAHSALCIKHFHESHIIKYQPYKNPTPGEIQKLLLQHPKLTEDAIPKVFDNLPEYLSKKEPPARTSPDCRREQVLKRNAGIGRFKIKEIPFREDFPCHSTWKRCKHSGHFSRFRNIIGNFCIIKQKCLCNYVINISCFYYR
jgi:hypothetical protein